MEPLKNKVVRKLSAANQYTVTHTSGCEADIDECAVLPQKPRHQGVAARSAAGICPDPRRAWQRERTAAKRLLSELRRARPHLKLIVIEDGLAANAPHIRHLQALDLRFILGAKQSDHTFLNTLKNQGYHFEHNVGHGHRHLSTVFMHLMMLAFLIGQIQQRGCRLCPGAVTAAKSKTRFWRKLRTRFDLCLIPDWETL